ncbi:hypothetical protein BDF14DRAFT_1734285, partial [Spinellus fusiger]
YHIIHKKLPFCSLLHTIIQFPTTLCSICNLEEHTLEYFLFLCPAKLPVWCSCWSTHIGITPVASSLQEAFFSLSLPQSKSSLPAFFSLSLPQSKSSLPAFTIFSCFLFTLWRHHWLTVFQD